MAAAGAAAVFYAGPVIVVEFDDGAAVPPLHQAHLPEGLVTAESETLCGSGGCYLWVEVDRELSSPAALEALEGRPSSCAIASPFDLRRVCVSLTEDRLSVRYERVLNL